MDTLAVAQFSEEAPWASPDGTAIEFLDWIVNGTSLRELAGAGVGNMTLLGDDEWLRSHQLESLRRLSGEPLPTPTYQPTYRRTRLERLLRLRGTPVAPFGAAFDDGRVGLLFCACGDIDCPTLSARIVANDDTVEWREIGWQVGYEPFSFDPANSVTGAVFERAPYIELIDKLSAAAKSPMGLLIAGDGLSR